MRCHDSTCRAAGCRRLHVFHGTEGTVRGETLNGSGWGRGVTRVGGFFLFFRVFDGCYYFTVA